MDRLERRLLTQLPHPGPGELRGNPGDPRLHLWGRLGEILAEAPGEGSGSEGQDAQKERAEHHRTSSPLRGSSPARLCVTENHRACPSGRVWYRESVGERGDGTGGENGVVISHTHLTPTALRGLVEEFVTRDGTDYGSVEKTLDQKVAALMRQLERGEATIVYDSESQTTSIVPRHPSR